MGFDTLRSRRLHLVAVSCGLLAFACTPHARDNRATSPIAPTVAEPVLTAALTERPVTLAEEILSGEGDDLVASIMMGVDVSDPATFTKGTPSWSFSVISRSGSIMRVKGWIRVILNGEIGVPKNTRVRGEMAYSLIGAVKTVTGKERDLTFTIPGFTTACPIPSNRLDAVRLVDMTRNRLIIRIPARWTSGGC